MNPLHRYCADLRQWERDLADLERDHAEYRSRLNAAMDSTPKERARVQQTAPGE